MVDYFIDLKKINFISYFVGGGGVETNKLFSWQIKNDSMHKNVL